MGYAKLAARFLLLVWQESSSWIGEAPVRSEETTTLLWITLLLMLVTLLCVDQALTYTLAEKQRDQLRRALREIRKRDKECP